MKRTTFDFPLSLERGGGEPLRAQLIRGLRAAVHTGRLSPGSPLPATRVLAADFGLSRGLVVEAYEQLLAEGYLTATRGSATRVAIPLPGESRVAAPVATVPRPGLPPPRPRFDFRPGIPDVALFPARAWMRALRRALAGDSLAVFDYPDPQGVEPARIALATYLNRARATLADPARVVLCTGFAQAARLVGEALRARGMRRIAVEDPGHAEQCTDLRASGLELVPVRVDDRGLRIDELAQTGAGAVLVTPAHQYPTGAVLAPERRAALLEWAARQDAFIIEDDYDAEYRYDREPVGALQGLAPDRVVYVGSASKVLAPSLRQGWLVLPASLTAVVAQAKLSADRGSPALEQHALAAFLEAGDLDRHLRRTRAIYRRRRDVLLEALEARTRGVAAGLHLLVDLPDGVEDIRLVEAAARDGIRVYSARAYYAWPAAAPPSPALLLGYGGISEKDIEPGIQRLVRLLWERRAVP
jgi:GntR family transcriptional regulator/MocR family aminotransferase